MPIFGRKQRHAEPRLIISRSTLGKLDGRQVPARFRVIAVTAPGTPEPVDAALITGFLLGPFPLQTVQLTQALAKDSWPTAGQELAAVADPDSPLTFAIVWGDVQGTGYGFPAGWHDSPPWDPGPGGTHQLAVVDYLAGAGFFAEDFVPSWDSRAPGMSAQLDAAAARYVTVIPGQVAVELMRTGEPAQGVVVAARKLPMPVQLMPSPQACYAWLTLDVTPPQDDTYRSTIRFGFRSPERFAAHATPGTHLPLRFNPADPALVTLDLPALGITPLVRSRPDSA